MTTADRPWHRILLATEHTEFDVGAERLALALARQTGHALDIVVPLVLNDELVIEAPALAERFDAEASARRGELLRAAQESGMRVDVRVRGDTDLSRAIVEHARETHPDLLVIRRRGRRSFLARVMIGEMSGNVASTAPCDVLMVPRARQPCAGRPAPFPSRQQAPRQPGRAWRRGPAPARPAFAAAPVHPLPSRRCAHRIESTSQV
mgnify:CR=1 FL=1